MWWWIHPGIGMFAWAIGLYNSNSGLKLPAAAGDEQYRQELISAKRRAAISLGIIIVFIVLTAIIGLIGSLIELL
jgi:hypothetical protein